MDRPKWSTLKDGEAAREDALTPNFFFITPKAEDAWSKLMAEDAWSKLMAEDAWSKLKAEDAWSKLLLALNRTP